MDTSLKITIPAAELYNSKTMMFTDAPEVTIELVHSLFSVSKWESQTGKAFLGREEKTAHEVMLYVQAMCQDQDITLETLSRIPDHEYERINAYIDGKHTATWFKEVPGLQRPSREIVTAELVYHWMFAMNVPMDLQHWHLNRLFTQLKVISEKNKPQKKQTPKDIRAAHRQINEANRQHFGTNG